MFIKANLFREVGLFDARSFCLGRVRLVRSRCQVRLYGDLLSEAKVYHRGSGAFNGGVPQTTYYWMRNRMLWIELNCPPEDRRRLLRRCRSESWLTFRRYCIKRIQSIFARSTPARQTRLRTYRAELTAVRHYHQRRFGKGTEWLTKVKVRADL